MKVLIISTFDSYGGASVAAKRLQIAFNKTTDIECRMLVMKKSSNDGSTFSACGNFRTYIEQIRSAACTKMTMAMLRASYLFSIGFSGIDLANNINVKWADIVYIHWTGGSFLSISGIKKLLDTGKPVYLYLHDMNYITGGCHHSFGCEGYTKDCKDCPIIRTRSLAFLSSYTLRRKVKQWGKNSNFNLVSPSIWLRDCAVKSKMYPGINNTHVIPNVINTDLFQPIERQTARRILNINSDKILICFGSSAGAGNPHKGWNYLIKSLAILRECSSCDVEILLFGSYLNEDEKKSLGYKIYELGYLHDAYSLMLMYNASDLFVNPSLAESFGQTALEAISCGTLAVGFNVGGLPDIIKNNVSGYLADYKSVDSLAECIEKAINNKTITREKLHEYAVTNFSENVVVEKYRKIFTPNANI